MHIYIYIYTYAMHIYIYLQPLWLNPNSGSDCLTQIIQAWENVRFDWTRRIQRNTRNYFLFRNGLTKTGTTQQSDASWRWRTEIGKSWSTSTIKLSRRSPGSAVAAVLQLPTLEAAAQKRRQLQSSTDHGPNYPAVAEAIVKCHPAVAEASAMLKKTKNSMQVPFWQGRARFQQ